MSERVSLGAAGQRLGVSGGDIRRAGYAKVTAGRLEAGEHEPPAWLRQGPGSQTPAGAAPGRGLVLRLRHCAGSAAQPGGGLHAPSVRPVQQERETTGGPQPARHGSCAHLQRGRILRRVRPPDRHSRGARQRSPGCCFGSRRLPERSGRAGVLMARFEIPDGWTVQAFQFALDCTPEQAACVRRQFGGRRYARNWAVRTLKEDLTRYRETGEETDAPSLAGLRKRWNQVKDTECVDAETGEVWWPQISKEAFADGIKAAVDAYWNWQTSRAGNRQGSGSGSRGSRRRAATGTGSPSPPARSGSNPTAGTSPSPGSAPSGSTRTPAAWNGSSPRAEPGSSPSLSPGTGPGWWPLSGSSSSAPSNPVSGDPASRVGVDVGVRVLATVADQHGEVIETGAEPAAAGSGAEGTAASVSRAVAPHPGLPPLHARPSGRSPGCNAGSPASAATTSTT